MARLSETGFYQAFSLVFVSEIGDKTFFIAGLLAMKAGRLISFVGSVGALAVMTLISVIIGQLFHAVPAGLTSGLPLDDIAAVIAFAFFGLKTLKDASEIQEGDTSGLEEELEEAETAVQESQTTKQLTAWYVNI
jgi:putative Ca2+/H+ antiporter (TMEM165/GDT1 family)